MLDGVIIQGTTPTHYFDIPEEYTEENVEKATVVYSHKGIMIKKTGEIVVFKNDDGTEDRKYKVQLGQEDTLIFIPGCVLSAQLKVKLKNGEVYASDELRFRVCRILDTEVF